MTRTALLLEMSHGFWLFLQGPWLPWPLRPFLSFPELTNDQILRSQSSDGYPITRLTIKENLVIIKTFMSQCFGGKKINMSRLPPVRETSTSLHFLPTGRECSRRSSKFKSSSVFSILTLLTNFDSKGRGEAFKPILDVVEISWDELEEICFLSVFP